MSLFNDMNHKKLVVKLTRILLTLVLEYPGIPGGRTFLGQPCKDCTIDENNYSELLRMFLESRHDARMVRIVDVVMLRSFHVKHGSKKTTPFETKKTTSYFYLRFYDLKFDQKSLGWITCACRAVAPQKLRIFQNLLPENPPFLLRNGQFLSLYRYIAN